MGKLTHASGHTAWGHIFPLEIHHKTLLCPFFISASEDSLTNALNLNFAYTSSKMTDERKPACKVSLNRFEDAKYGSDKTKTFALRNHWSAMILPLHHSTELSVFCKETLSLTKSFVNLHFGSEAKFLNFLLNFWFKTALW